MNDNNFLAQPIRALEVAARSLQTSLIEAGLMERDRYHEIFNQLQATAIETLDVEGLTCTQQLKITRNFHTRIAALRKECGVYQDEADAALSKAELRDGYDLIPLESIIHG